MKNYIKYLISNYKIFRILYRQIIHIYKMFFYIIKYKVANPKLDIEKINKVIFIAHPDDEILSMGNFIIKNSENMLVVSFTNGGNITRLNEFKSAMNALNIQYQMWNFVDAIDYKWNEKKVLKKIKKILALKEEWKMVITHNMEGDYGHFQHKEVSRLVRKAYKGNNIFMPVSSKKLFEDKNKLKAKESEEKIEFFKNYYKSQKHILILYEKYFKFEKIIKY